MKTNIHFYHNWLSSS